MQSAPHPMSSRRSGSDRVRSVGSGAEDWSIVIQVKLLRKYLLWHLPISRHGQRSSRSLLPPAHSYELRSWLHCSAATPLGKNPLPVLDSRCLGTKRQNRAIDELEDDFAAVVDQLSVQCDGGVFALRARCHASDGKMPGQRCAGPDGPPEPNIEGMPDATGEPRPQRLNCQALVDRQSVPSARHHTTQRRVLGRGGIGMDKHRVPPPGIFDDLVLGEPIVPEVEPVSRTEVICIGSHVCNIPGAEQLVDDL